MKPFAGVSGITLKEIAQSLLEGKRMARSIENIADTFEPLVDAEDTETLANLEAIREHSQNINRIVQRIYNKIAKDAMKE